MSAIVRIKRSLVTGDPSILPAGQLAYSALPNDGVNGGDTLYIGMGTETNGNAANHVVIGGKFFTDAINAATSLDVANTIVKRDEFGNIVVNSITGTVNGNAATATHAITADHVPYSGLTGTVPIWNQNTTGNAATATHANSADSATNASYVPYSGLTGTVPTWNQSTTGNAATASKWLQSRNLSLTGDATATLTAVDGSVNVSAAITLKTVNSSVGSYGSSTAIPVITVNEKGLVTGVSTSTISTALTISDGSASDSVSLLNDALSFIGGTGVTTSVTNNQVSFAIGQAVNTTSNVTFNNVSVNGTLYSNDVTASSVTVAGDAIITGNLTVQGTTTTINSTVVQVSDVNIILAKDATNAASANGGGITVHGPDVPATLTYTSADNRWNLNKDLNVNTVYGALSGNAATASKWASGITLTLNSDVSATLSGVDGSGNVSASVTLATVNNNAGTYGNSVTVPYFTVNQKGLITSAGSNAIPLASTTVLGLSSFDSSTFSVTSGAVSVTRIDGGTY